MQAALLAQQDSRSPSVVVALAALFNLVADVALIVGCGLGLTGAAIATVATQYLSLAALAYVCCQPQRLSPDFSALFHQPPAPVDTPPPPAEAPGKPSSGDLERRQVLQDAVWPSAPAEGPATLAAVLSEAAAAPPSDAPVPTASAAEAAAPAEGGGGAALALVYAAKLACYFLVQVRPLPVTRTLPCVPP